MARSIYITSPEGDTGKSTVALGILDLLTHRVERVGVYRPVARSTTERDYVLDLLLAHDGVDLTYEQCVGVTYDEVHEDPEAALSEIVARFHDVQRHCDIVVIVGTDYTDVAGPAELTYNARIAANLGAPVLLVVRGADRTPDEIRQVVEVSTPELRASHTQLIAVIANRCVPSQLYAVREALAGEVPVLAIPD